MHFILSKKKQRRLQTSYTSIASVFGNENIPAS